MLWYSKGREEVKVLFYSPSASFEADTTRKEVVMWMPSRKVFPRKLMVGEVVGLEDLPKDKRIRGGKDALMASLQRGVGYEALEGRMTSLLRLTGALQKYCVVKGREEVSGWQVWAKVREMLDVPFMVDQLMPGHWPSHPHTKYPWCRMSECGEAIEYFEGMEFVWKAPRCWWAP